MQGCRSFPGDNQIHSNIWHRDELEPAYSLTKHLKWMVDLGWLNEVPSASKKTWLIKLETSETSMVLFLYPYSCNISSLIHVSICHNSVVIAPNRLYKYCYYNHSLPLLHVWFLQSLLTASVCMAIAISHYCLYFTTIAIAHYCLYMYWCCL